MAEQPSAVSRLPLSQQAALTSGGGDFTTQEAPGVPALLMSDGPHGLRLPKNAGNGGQADLRSAAPATCFPPAVALGNSWDPELAQRVAGAIAAEARAFGVHVVLGPGINLKRSPLCGRNFEYFSEDPHLTAELGGAMVRGLQRAGVAASLKHFAANNQETDRMRVSADIDERPLREMYLRAFERIVRRDRPWTVMAAYNAVNGVPLCENEHLLTSVLRDEWGFDGVVVSDWGAVRDRTLALMAGLDLQMPGTDGRTDQEVLAAVEDGRLPAQALHTAVERIALLARRVTAADAPPPPAETLFPRHHALAREVAERSVVLLKNEDGLLPLDPGTRPGTLAVIGELARTPRFQGAGSSQVTPTRLDTPLDELRKLAPTANIAFAPGYRLPGGEPTGPAEADGNVGHPDDAAADEAEALAARSDTAVVFLGLPAQDESEGFDREHLSLPRAQLALLERVVAVQSRVVVVLAHGGTVCTAPWQEWVPALVDASLLGQGGGHALARVLLGAAEPRGRLAETVPMRLEDSPSYLSFPGEEGRVRYGEGLFVGHRGHDARRTPVAFPFGHGLSYTTFEHRDLRVSWDADAQHAEVTVTVANTGHRAGREVVQVYLHGPDGSPVVRPERELRGFTGVELAPGEQRDTTVTLARDDFAHYSEREAGWRVEGGTWRIDVGASSRDIRLSAPCDVQGDPSRLTLTGRNTLAEWYAHPEGAPALAAAFAEGRGADGPPSALDDPLVHRFLSGVPLDVIAEFPQSPLGAEGLSALVDRLATERAGGSTAPRETS
ncbi:glycoside hydrolase family 3 C-terminal domain-containing protein [Streptomyces sp. NPDC002790]|uniref:glycoside hydrolase family 3 C-terminal domain-containing protein n=1 Tax=Streptomyces sp. NPDC002790 TaxID=3154431 RepID=UPI003325D630